jgi:phage baseplate assembly protein W
MAEKPVVVYKDFNMNFQANPISEDLAVLTNELAVAQSLKNLLLTDYGEVPFNSVVGSGIREMLFEPVSEIVTLTLKDKIVSTIKNFEPRITLIGLGIKDDAESNSYIIDITYKIVVSSKTYNVSISLDRLQ